VVEKRSVRVPANTAVQRIEARSLGCIQGHLQPLTLVVRQLFLSKDSIFKYWFSAVPKVAH